VGGRGGVGRGELGRRVRRLEERLDEFSLALGLLKKQLEFVELRLDVLERKVGGGGRAAS